MVLRGFGVFGGLGRSRGYLYLRRIVGISIVRLYYVPVNRSEPMHSRVVTPLPLFHFIYSILCILSLQRTSLLPYRQAAIARVIDLHVLVAVLQLLCISPTVGPGIGE